MPMTSLGGYDADFADKIRRMLQLGGAAPGVQPAAYNSVYDAAAGVPLTLPGGTAATPAGATVPPNPPAAPPVPSPSGSSVTAAPPGQGALPQARGQASPPFPAQSPTPWFTPSNTPTPWRGQTSRAAAASSSPASTSTAAPIPPKRPAVVGAPNPGSANLGYYPPNPRFGTMQSGVPSGRGPLGNNPIYTTMNFGGGAKAPPAAAPSAAAPAAAAPAAKTANAYPGDDWTIDAQGNVVPTFGGQDPTQMNPDQLAAAASNPNWPQNLGGGVTASGLPNNPAGPTGALASAVNKPNWWQNLFGVT